MYELSFSDVTSRHLSTSYVFRSFSFMENGTKVQGRQTEPQHHDDPAFLAPLKPYLSRSNPTFLSLFCVLATFITYFAAAAFRKAVFAHTYESVDGWFGTTMSFKTAVSLNQTIGLLISKITGIKYVF
jgi:hypothetical protein